MKLHVLTAVSRPENLPLVAESLATAAVSAPDVQVVWHWGFDLDRAHIGGQAVKNALLDEIDDGWCWCLDDDTLAHPDVLEVVYGVIDDEARAVIVSQHRNERPPLRASPDLVRPGDIDIGQAFLRRDLIGDHRIPETYEGDGLFLQDVLRDEWALFVDEVVSLHNAISRLEMSV